MKKVLALVLAVVMVAGMASIATFAAAADPTTTVTMKVDGKKVTDPTEAATKTKVAGGKEIVVELENAKAAESYKVELEKQDDCPSGASVSLKSQDGKKFTFVVNCKPTEVADGANMDYKIIITALNDKAKAALGGLTDADDPTTFPASVVKEILIDIGLSDDSNIVKEADFQGVKDANKDATIKATIKVGDIEISNVTTPRDINKEMYGETPSAIAEALKGKNYAYAGFKYRQALPGVGTMKIDLGAELLLANASKVYVYEVSGDTFSLVASSASDKMFEVKDGAVKFPVSATSQWIITDKALTSTSTSSGTTSPFQQQ